MLQVQPLGARVPIFRQLQADRSPVILVNIFQVAETDIPSLEQYPASTIASPYLFTRLSVANLCVGP